MKRHSASIFLIFLILILHGSLEVSAKEFYPNHRVEILPPYGSDSPLSAAVKFKNTKKTESLELLNWQKELKFKLERFCFSMLSHKSNKPMNSIISFQVSEEGKLINVEVLKEPKDKINREIHQKIIGYISHWQLANYPNLGNSKKKFLAEISWKREKLPK